MRNSQSGEETIINLSLGPFDRTSKMVFPEIPGYKVLKMIGEGANAHVFKGIQKKSGREVAIKVLRPSKQEDEDCRHRFRRELEFVSRCSHRYIIKIFEVGKTGKHYIVMEYLKYSLSNLLRDRGGKLDKKEALKITRKLAKALKYSHSRGVIHRDIKPANILFRRSGQPVLADFGLVRSVHSQSDFTRPFTILGTPHYMSPEQCQGEKVDKASDIYSLGVVLFEMLSGRLPYNGSSWTELFKQHTDPSIPIPRLPSEARDCQVLIDLMMAKDKQMRPDALHVCRMVEGILLENSQLKSRWRRKRKFLFFLMSGLIVAFVIIVILILFFI